MTSARPRTRLVRRAIALLAVCAALFSVVLTTARAGTPAGYAEYIIPFDEDVFAYVTEPVATGAPAIAATTTTFTLVSVTAWSDSVTVYIDHWENGYGYDPDHPDATADEKYGINASQTLNFNSLAVPRPRTGVDGNTYIGVAGNCAAQPAPVTALIRVTTDYCYDGRDRIITIGGATTVTRGGYFNNALGKLAAIGEEVFPLAPQLIKYVLPFGEDGGRSDYNRVMAVIQATEDNTTIRIDFNNDGTFDAFNTENGYRTARVDPVDATTLTLQKGQTYVLDRDSDGIGGTLNRGTVVLGDKTLQVEYFYGQTESNYNTRAVSAYPNGFWGKDYYLSADGSASGDTDALLYNPNASAITITWQTSLGSGSFSLAANTTGFFQNLSGAFVPDGSGLYLHGSDTFWGTSDVDSNQDRWDWGYSMVPDYLASDDQTVAWAPGNSPALACNVANGRGNGLFLTPLLDNTTVFIDTTGDGLPDTDASIEVLRGTTPVTATGSGYRANRLESLYITGSNSGTSAGSLCDLTGARIYATGPFVMSYGENPEKASTAGGLDLGYTVLPSPGNWMDLALTVDKATSPQLVSTTPGATAVTYTLVVKSHEFDIETLRVDDVLPSGWEFVPGFTSITYPDLTTASTDPSVSGLNLAWGTGVFPGGMRPNQQITIAFRARTTLVSTFVAGDLTQNKVVATGTRTVDSVTQTFKATDFVFNYFDDDGTVRLDLTKTSSVAEATPVSPGDTLTYTMTVSNPASSSANLTGVTLLDPLPPGVTYVPGSGSVVCEVPFDVEDSFNTNGSYSGNNGSVNWNAAWTETSDDGSAASGTILVTGNILLFDGNGTADRSVARTTNVSGQTSVTVSFSMIDTGIDAGETVVAEYSLDGGAYVTIGTLDGSAGYSGSNPATIALSGNSTLTLRFRAPQAWSAGGDSVDIDNVRIIGVSATRNVRDEFAAVAYTNNGPGNTDSWATAWSETDNLGGGAASGLAQVTGAALRLGWAENVRDQFDTNGVYTGSNGSTPWATNWSETDIQSSTSGAGAGFVLVTGNTLQLRYQTATVVDNLNSAAYNLNAGTNNWTGNWTESGDDGVATTGVVTANGTRLNFGPGTTGRSISRSAAVSGGSATITFTLSDNGIDGGEGLIAEYQLDSGGFTTLQTIDNATLTPAGAPFTSATISTAGASTITLRFRSFDTGGTPGVFEAGDNAGVDGVTIAFTNAVGSHAQRTFDLTGASGLGPSLSFTTAVANLEASDTVVVEAGSSASGPFTTLATYAAGTPSVAGPYDLSSYISATTTIRFRVTGNYNATDETFSIDNVNVTYRRTPATSVQRTVDLSSAVNPSLSFAATAANLEAGDTLVVEASSSAGGPFTTLATYTAGTPSVAGPYSLTPYLSSATTVRFRITGGYDQTNETMSIDNVDITSQVTIVTSTFTSQDPPELLAAATGCQVRPDHSMTVSFNVTVDSPFPNVSGVILNTATAGAAEIPLPQQASARNIVIVPSGASATVGDRVWLDTDRDGIADPGEVGIPGVQLTLKDSFGTPLQVTTTDSLGRYTFLNVRPGTGYYVEVSGGLPSGLTQTTATVGDQFNTSGVFTGNTGSLDWLTNWTESGEADGASAGFVRIANTRMEFQASTPADRSLRRSVDVTGATALTLSYLWASTALETDNSDEFVVEYATADGGPYTILRTINGGVGPTTFTDTIAWTPTNPTLFIRFRALDALEAGELASFDNVQVSFPLANRTSAFNLSAGEDYVLADLGYRPATGTAAIGDLVWVDANADQTRNPGEVGLEGITVDLYEHSNTCLPGDEASCPYTLVASTVTGPGGAYLFTGIAADGIKDYEVTVYSPQSGLAGYTATTGLVVYLANLPSGALRTEADFGFRNPTGTFSIKDGIWLDNGIGGGTEADGIRNGTEAGIAGVTVDLLNESGDTIATVTTASDGTFQFTGVPANQNYSWRVTDLSRVLDDFYGTTASALSTSFQMTGDLTADLDYTAPSDIRHFGYNQIRSIGDTVFNDNGEGGGTLGNGVQDGSEPGINGVTVLLYRDVDNDNVFEPGADDGAAYATQVTDASGKYLFAGLPSGSRWFVSIDSTQSALSGFTLTTLDSSGVAGHQMTVPTLSGANNNLAMDFGYRATTPFSVSGRLFNDANRNGVDGTEPGLAGVTVVLRNSNGVIVATTTTASDGSYSFAGQPAGTYTVQVTDTDGVLSDYETTREQTEGGLAGTYNGREVVSIGPSVTGVDFGYYRSTAPVTRVTVTSFVARDLGGSVAIEWETSSENGTIGFFLRRWDPQTGEFVPVNERLLPSLLTPHGGVYRYVDGAANPGASYRYKLIEVEASGRRNAKGPYEVNTTVTAERDAATYRPQMIEPDPRASGYASAARVGRRPASAAIPGASLLTAGRGAPRSASTRIAVTSEGIHYVSFESLNAAAGGATPSPTSLVKTGPPTLTQGGSAVAWAPADDGSGFLFYGQALDSLYARDNVYRFGPGKDSVQMKARRDAPTSLPAGDRTFTRVARLEQDLVPAPGLFRSADSDYWLWDFAFGGDAEKPFPFRADGATGSGAASILIRLKGGSDTEADPDHHAILRLNGQEIGDVSWNGLDAIERTFAVDSRLIVDGENTLSLESRADTEAPYSLIYLDSFDVSFESVYRATNNRAEVSSGGNASILISGFNRPDVMVFDVTDPRNPVRVTGLVAPLPDGGFGVGLRPRRENTAYVALTPDAVMTPARIEADQPSNLKSTANQARYLIVTTSALVETAWTLASYRDDMSSLVVDIQDVYDEFGSGIPSPYALRAFLAYAASKWRERPEYVVLAGDGTWDYKDTLGMGNALPPMMVGTPHGLFPSDVWFANVDTASDAPEFALGRLPVSTPEELSRLIEKIQAREAASGASWMNRALMANDDPDVAGDFVASSAEIAASLPPDALVTTISLPELGIDAARTMLIDGINEGAGMVNYIGHGGYGVLADEGLLWSEDADYLTNSDRSPVMTAMTCLAGNFGLPWIPALGEVMVRKEGAGLAAIWAPTGMSENDFAVTLARKFYAAASIRGANTRIGDAIQVSMKAYSLEAAPQYMLSIYALLGDPAMKLR